MISTFHNALHATDVPDLIPARMLNEFAYCPRLAYLEWVQGEFVDNLETLEGRFGHRRVDQPSRKEPHEPNAKPTGNTADEDYSPNAPADDEPTDEPGDDTIHSRSVMLSAPNERLIAKIDLLETQPGMAIPIDYKRGRVPDVPGNAWEPEQVQLCAQGLILRECGYLCEGGMLYYIQSRRRVSIPFDETLVDRTRELIAQMLADCKGVQLKAAARLGINRNTLRKKLQEHGLEGAE